MLLGSSKVSVSTAFLPLMPSIAVDFFFFSNLLRLDKYKFDLPITMVLFCDGHAVGIFQTIFANREAS